MQKLADASFSCMILSMSRAMPDVKVLLEKFDYTNLKIGNGTAAWFIGSFACVLHYEPIDFDTLYSQQNVPVHHSQFTIVVKDAGHEDRNIRLRRAAQARTASLLARDLLPLTDAVSVYWNNFRLMSTDTLALWDSEELPAYLWIAVIQDKTTQLPLTRGLSDFGLPELRFVSIEVEENAPSNEEFGELLIVFADHILGGNEIIETGYAMDFYSRKKARSYQLRVSRIGTISSGEEVADIVVSELRD